MNSDIQKLRKIVAKSFRRAKAWYSFYFICQLAVLAFAVISIFSKINPNLSAAIAFAVILATEIVRWRSDCWKSEGEAQKRKLETADGFGTPIDGQEIANWLVSKPRHFINDVKDDEVEGSQFDSVQPKGACRAVENTQESAWWSKHESQRMGVYLGIALAFVVGIAFVALVVSIGSLKSENVQQSGTAVQNVGGIICAVLVFVFSINLVRLLIDFCSFASNAGEVLKRCNEMLKSANITDTEALSVMHDYQTARNSAPLLPTFIWKWHCNHLREQWECFRPHSKK